MSESRVLSNIVWTPERGLPSAAPEPEVRSLHWNQILSGDDLFFGSRWNTESEVRVNPDTALQSTVVLASCRILAETIASLPIHVYRRTDDGYKAIARDIPLYKVLSFAPNDWQTKFEFFEQMVMNLTLWGNSYSLIQSGRYGAVSSLHNLHPSRMDVERLENGRLRYSYMNPETGRYERYTQDNIMHVRWTAEPDGIKGMVPIEIGREAIGLARACEIHAAKYWANNAKPGIVLQTDGTLSPEAAERLRDNWERLHRGVDRSWKTCVLTNGLKAEQIGFNAEQSQFESTRRFQSEEIARVYRLPLHLIQGQGGGDLETSGQEFVTYTLVPWLRRIESAISRSLIYNDDIFFAEFDTRGLMRGNSNSRAAYYSTMMNLGILSVNEVRRFENLAPLGPEADNHFVGMNMQTLEQASQPKDQQMPGMPPAEVPGSPPSLSEVKTGKAPPPSPRGEGSEKKDPLVEYAEGKIGRVKHVMEKGTLDLKSGEKIEVEPGKPVALVVDEESGEEVGVEASKLKRVEKRSVDCGRTDDGKFGSGNKCQDEGDGVPETPSSSGSRGNRIHDPDVTRDSDGDGVADSARVGVPAFEVPPPPKVGRLPNLPPVLRQVEESFAAAFESRPEELTESFLKIVTSQEGVPTFGTDDAKALTDAWSEEDPEKRAENRATLNIALHQTANAIAKRAFLSHLDTLSEGDEIMVTVGGCGAGKGFALKNVPQAQEMKNRSKAVWDSAGDQNATENPWILQEASKRGLKVTFVYVHADPKTQWADPNRGVVKRASDPKDGRMVDARVFADSYALGAKNHHAFHQANKDNPSAAFVFLDNTGKPSEISGVPEDALRLDSDELADFADREVERSQAPDRVKRGATVGRSVWRKRK